MRPWSVNVADLVYRPGARRRVQVVAPLGHLQVVDTSVAADSDVAVELVLEWVTDGVLATGTLTARWAGECRRCLRPVAGDAAVSFQELFETSPRDGESYRLAGEHLDLEPLAREALLLELPLAPVCDEACRGLCPTCGADLNAGPCRCRPEADDARWAALDVLRGEGFEPE